jgi:type II secretory pathway component PulF
MSDSSWQVRERGALSADEAARLSERTASLTRDGLPLGPGLAALGEELPRGRLRSALTELALDLEQGLTLEQAVEKQKDRVPPHLRGLVLGGLRSGRLGDIMGRFTGYISIGTEIRRRLEISLAYPILATVVALALFVFVSTVLVVMFENVFRDFGVPLPAMTRALLFASRLFREAWPVLVIVGGILLGLWILPRFILEPAQRGSLATKAPLVGKVWRYVSWAEFCHLLALLLESRLPLPEALHLTGEGVENSDLDRACLAMASEVEGGASLAQALAARRELPRALSRLLRWAADSSATAEILHMTGEMFEARARSQATFAGTVMAVLAFIFVLWGLITVVFGLMLPLITLISKLSG